MNASERQVADVLDELHLQWEYEPHLFVLREDESGACLEGFRPDFYIPKYDLYVEVTMAKSYDNSIKNRKARLTRERYPGTRIGLVFRRHFDDLKTRILELVAEAQLENPL